MKVITRLIGGLGNQMFQYAVGRALSIAQNGNLFLDISSFESYELHGFGLDQFNMSFKISSVSDRRDCIIYKERSYNYDPLLANVDYNVILDGYFQSQKYFSSIRSNLLEDFSFHSRMSSRIGGLLSKIKSSCSVSIHFRRGDYNINSYEDQVLEVLGMDYYTSALKIVSEMVPSPTFYIFSDDINWVMRNFDIKHNHVFVDSQDHGHIGDLQLMSACQHNITANSTFSWWAAWLNQNPEKIIISPSNWFSRNAKKLNTVDLIPQEWILV